MSSQTLRCLAEAGKIYPDTPIRKEGGTKSVPACKVKGLLKNYTQTHIDRSQMKSDHTPSIRTFHEQSYVSTDEIPKKDMTGNINNSRAENTILVVVRKAISIVLGLFAIIAILSPFRTIILQAAIVITGLWALITGKIWIVADKYTVKSSTARGIGALLVSAAPLSFVGGIVVINQYSYTNDAKTYGTLIEVGIFGTIAIVSYIIYRVARQGK